MRINYSIVFVSDMNRSIEFYRDVLEIPLKYETPQWSEFATEGATLALHSSEDSVGDTMISKNLSPGTCCPGFSVEDLDGFHSRMTSYDVVCIQKPKENFGVRIAQYVDPDGLVFSVSESKHDR